MFAASKTASVSGGYQISRSLRFNNPTDTAYLNRTPATTTNRRTWTWSAWIKRGLIDLNYRTLFSNGTAVDSIMFWNTDSFAVRNFNGSSYDLILTQVFRDPSAWYHFVVAMDTTQATSSDRIKIYVNGVQVTAFSSATYPSQNYDTGFNTTTVQYIGWNEYNYFNGYLTELNWIDGQQLTPSSFGETNAQTGVWGPKKYSGSYGTNGFYLNFSDNSNTTAATLGADYSGNGNNWTPNNFSVTAGAGNDSLVDSPTSYGTDTGAGGSVRGNYSTFNPLAVAASTPTFSNGNLDLSASAAWNGSVGTIGVNSGKWYWETVCGNGDAFIGICGSNAVLTTSNPQNINGTIVYYGGNGEKRIDGNSSAYGASYTTETIGVALDIDGGTVTFYKNNTSQGSISLSSSTLNGLIIFPFFVKYSSTMTVNFGQRAFAYTAPSGFKALCTQNLPTPTIGATTATTADKYFGVNTWTGNGTSQTITNGGFQPDWVWVKERSAVRTHCLTDSVRGFTKYLFSDSTGAEETYSTLVTSVNSTGFNLGASIAVNDSGQTYVGWQWKANGSGSSNTAGSITSTVSANTTSGFSIVTYTGTGANATIGHGLGTVPQMMIVKNRGTATGWRVYQVTMGNVDTILLNSDAVKRSDLNPWNSTTPTSTVFSVSTDAGVNESGVTIVAYCFAPIAGYSAFGSYTGNGSADGPFVFTNMRPAYVMVKRTDSTSDWYIWDTKRDTYNVVTNTLEANTSDAEASATSIDDLSNGFKCRSATVVNASGGTYIYMAFAESPFKYSLAR